MHVQLIISFSALHLTGPLFSAITYMYVGTCCLSFLQRHAAFATLQFCLARKYLPRKASPRPLQTFKKRKSLTLSTDHNLRSYTSCSNLKMSGKVVFKYFDLKARGEPARILLALAGIKYEDVRIPMEEWPKLKECKFKRHFT